MVIIFSYAEGIALLRQNGVEQEDEKDLSTANEKTLGRIVRGFISIIIQIYALF